MKQIIKNTIILTIITLIAGVALACVYSITKEPIAKADEKATIEAYKIVFSQADSFEKIDVNDYSDENNSKVIAVSKATKGDEFIGYVMTTASKGYGGDIKIAIGIDLKGTLTGISVLDASNETPGLGAKVTEDEFTSKFKSISDSETDDIDTISGATYSSNGVKNAVKAGFEYFSKNLKGDN